VEPDDESGRYRLGVGVFEVGAAVLEHLKLGEHLNPPMERLADLTKEAVSLAIRSGGAAVIIKRFESSQLLRAEIRVGTRMPLHSSASGKCLLAFGPEIEIYGVYPEEELPVVTEATIRRRSTLLRELTEVRQAGFAINKDEFTTEVSAVAVPVRDPADSVVAALSVAAPSARFHHQEWLEPLFSTANEMSPGIGWYAQGGERRRSIPQGRNSGASVAPRQV
jgi:DNA-binding IclR family transcriptional regulator